MSSRAMHVLTIFILALTPISYLLFIDFSSAATVIAKVTCNIVPPPLNASIKGKTTLSRPLPEAINTTDAIILSTDSSGDTSKLRIENDSNLTYIMTLSPTYRFIDKSGQLMKLDDLQLQHTTPTITDKEQNTQMSGTLIECKASESPPEINTEAPSITINFN